MDLGKFEKKEYFVNRELSWLKFDERVLSEARDKNLPLFDRLKFLSITASNLDEFFMVRVASLKDQVHAGYHKTDIAGMTAKEQLKEISVRTHELVHVQYNTLNRSLIPALEKAGMHLVAAHENLTEAQSAFVDRYFEDNVYPVLTPMAMDSSRPFPLIRNKTLNIGALISKKEKSDKLNKKDKAGELLFATVQVPSVLPRVVQIPSKKDGDTTVILLEEIIERNIDKLFLSYDVICAHPYRIMRNADLTIDEDEAEDLLVEIQRQLKKRQWGEVIRLEVEDKMDERLLKILKTEFDIKEADVFEINGPLDLTMLMKVYGADGFDAYKTPRYQPAPVPEFQNEKDIFQVIREGDVFLHHPYMSFDPVVNFVRQAAKDPDVLANCPSWQAMSDYGRKYHIYLIAGSMPEADDVGKVYNTSYIFDRDGKQIGKHRKAHLFDINVKNGQHFKESDTLTSGDHATVFDTEFGKMGVMICYDIRFPEFARTMVLDGARMIFVPAAFNMTTGPAHWELTFRARALDNQIYMLGCAPARDTQAGYISWGHSIVTDPWGQVMKQLDEKEGILIEEIDLDREDQIREQLPLLKHRKSEMYHL